MKSIRQGLIGCIVTSTETRWPPALPGDGWDTGVPVGWLRELSEYWRNDYDWKAAERELNQIPQFTTTIDGQRIYFMHVRSAEPDALPLILTHGWPGSVVEFIDVIGPLTNPTAAVVTAEMPSTW